MEILIRKHRSGTVRYIVWTKEEAEEKGIPYKHWRNANPGGWALTDDGFIVNCLQRGKFTSKRGREVDILTFSIGRMFGSSKELNWIERRNKHAYDTGTKTWQEKEKGKTRTKNMVREYVRQVLGVRSGELRGIDYHKVGMAYRKDQKIPEAAAKRMLKQEVIKDMVAEEMRKVLDESGVSDQYVIDLLMRAADIATSTADASAMIRAAQVFIKLRDMDPKEKLLPQSPADEEALARAFEYANTQLPGGVTDGADQSANQERPDDSLQSGGA